MPRHFKNLNILFVLLMLFHSRGFSQPPDGVSDSTAHAKYSAQIHQINPGLSFVYEKPGAFDHFKRFPGDISRYFQITFRKKNLIKIGAMASITALLVAVDQPILDETKRFGRRIGLNGNRRMKTAFEIGGWPMEVPHDTDTWLYFIGDGWVQTGITAAFLGYGLMAKSNRALTTSSQLAEGLLTTAFAVQLLKHITGRESPHVATADAGKWRLFPNQIEYHKRVPNYDAFPSGHLAVAMMTVTVISGNYPENKLVRPIGYSLMTILAFQMVNNGVHWVSDYPLALSMGYTFAKIALERGGTSPKNAHAGRATNSPQTSVLPYVTGDGLGVRFSLAF
ncbi:MAG: phosphatase PAP2 family protein [bacterium]